MARVTERKILSEFTYSVVHLDSSVNAWEFGPQNLETNKLTIKVP